ncbi:MAG: FtsX-like permease family protein [Saprospiraceae bacterium]
MNLPFQIARRYLFAKKSTNAINIITGISVLGLTIGTAALILVLSVFNGFEDLLSGLFSNFNPDVKVVPTKGKTFAVDSISLEKIMALEEVETISKSLEEVAFFEYEDNQDFGSIKGVDKFYKEVTAIDSTLREGDYLLEKGEREFLVLGAGMRMKLGVNIENRFEPVTVYMPKRKKVSALQQPFIKKFAYPTGTFSIQQDFDNRYILSSLRFAQDLLNMPNQISALEIKLTENANAAQAVAAIQTILGADFTVKDRYRQDEAFLKIMNLEKWLSYLIVSLTILLVAFNMIGSLWMIVLEKKKDIAILKSMGAEENTIRNIFLNEGLLMSLLGAAIGTALAVLLYVLQINFKLVTIPQGFLVDAYPISMRFTDVLIVLITVLTIGLIASIPPALRAKRISALIREE